MKEKVVMWVVGMMIERLGEEEVREWVDKGLDLLEKKVKESTTKYDDMVVLPLIKVAREVFNIKE